LKRKVAAILAVTAIALGAYPIASKAAGPAPAPQASGRQDPNWLHLTPAQQNKMKARQQRMNAAMQSLINDKKMTNAQKSAKAQTLQKAYEADMMAMLTPAQKVLVNKQKAAFLKRKKFADARMKQIMDVQAKLLKSLTPSQQKQITAIRTADMKVFQSIQSDTKMSESDKQNKVEDLNKDERTKINAILTPTQRSDFQHLQDLMPAGPGVPR
jgi:uncharacterized protein YihD (DUF1040 family)